MPTVLETFRNLRREYPRSRYDFRAVLSEARRQTRNRAPSARPHFRAYKTLGRAIAVAIANEDKDAIIDALNEYRQEGAGRAFSALQCHPLMNGVVCCRDCCHFAIENEDRLCDSCRERYVTCDHCDALTESDETTTIAESGREVCESCRSRYYHYWEADREYHDEREPEEIGEARFPNQGKSESQSRIWKWLHSHCDKLQVVDMPTNGITQEGLDRIAHRLALVFAIERERGIDAPFVYTRDVQNWVGDPNTKEVHWSLPKGGTLPKRLARFVKTHFNIKLAPKDLGYIGDTAQSYCPKTTQIVFRITQTYDFSREHYNHGNASCWWPGGAYGNSLTQWASQHQCFAILRYPDEDRITHHHGVGRSWGVVKNGCLYLVNTYGPNKNGVTDSLAIARTLATLLGSSYKSSHVINNGCSTEDGGFYFNGGGSGHVIFDDEEKTQDPCDLKIRFR